MFGGHTEQAMSFAGLSPNTSDSALRGLAFVKAATFVFDNENAPVMEHGDEIRIRLLVEKLEPKRSPFPSAL